MNFLLSTQWNSILAHVISLMLPIPKLITTLSNWSSYIEFHSFTRMWSLKHFGPLLRDSYCLPFAFWLKYKCLTIYPQLSLFICNIPCQITVYCNFTGKQSFPRTYSLSLKSLSFILLVTYGLGMGVRDGESYPFLNIHVKCYRFTLLEIHNTFSHLLWNRYFALYYNHWVLVLFS